ncbi:MAG: tetratricopeptide repeat protein [Planctomycetota bacterium]|nr:tetratricopeptide repeat protein [Planctomycetota bacterium]
MDACFANPGPLRKFAGSTAIWLAVLSLAPSSLAHGANIFDAEELFASGQYTKCVEVATAEIKKRNFSEPWRILKTRAEMAQGQYATACETIEAALSQFPGSIRLRWLAHEVLPFSGKAEKSRVLLNELERIAGANPGRYSDAGNLITLGQYYLHKGADARQVLNVFFKPVKTRLPDYVDIYLACGELALSKHDYELAAEEFRRAEKLMPLHPQVHYGLARALASSQPELAGEALEKALKHNPRHVNSLLLKANHFVDAEAYTEADEVIQEVLAVNPEDPSAWALRAVIAHLNNDQDKEQESRDRALKHWATNPAVDALIGRKLSQKYRFQEGAEYQQQALEFDKSYLAAKIQLSQDLLRLGQEEEGWSLAAEVFDADGYHIVAHNLVQLKQELAKFTTLRAEGLIVRMDSREAGIYGDRALTVLSRARRHLGSKYATDLDTPVIVEIFPQQQDFAIRTFGLPGGAGFLGVCFGNVITVNSPASQGENPANWESVLWHEFCHVVTLRKTQNRMPRWLSEGISVYEERQENDAWGQSMTPRYRQMILSDALTPVSQLSGAFLRPASPLHLQFAYYEASLVVEYLIEQFGFPALQQVLDDLGKGISIVDALQRHTASQEFLDKEFAKYAQQLARDWAAQADWKEPDLPPDADLAQWIKWNESHPDNYWGLQQQARLLLSQQDWRAAETPLLKLATLVPQDSGETSVFRMLATVYQKLDDQPREETMWKRVAELTSDSHDAYQRLMEFSRSKRDWAQLATNAQRMLAVNPLLPATHRWLAEAADQRNDRSTSIAAYRSLLAMDPVDPAESHFQLAQLLYRESQPAAARRQLLKSLEHAPDYRAALSLLLELRQEASSETPPEPTAARTDAP